MNYAGKIKEMYEFLYKDKEYLTKSLKKYILNGDIVKRLEYDSKGVYSVDRIVVEAPYFWMNHRSRESYCHCVGLKVFDYRSSDIKVPDSFEIDKSFYMGMYVPKNYNDFSTYRFPEQFKNNVVVTLNRQDFADSIYKAVNDAKQEFNYVGIEVVDANVQIVPGWSSARDFVTYYLNLRVVKSDRVSGSPKSDIFFESELMRRCDSYHCPDKVVEISADIVDKVRFNSPFYLGNLFEELVSGQGFDLDRNKFQDGSVFKPRILDIHFILRKYSEFIKSNYPSDINKAAEESCQRLALRYEISKDIDRTQGLFSKGLFYLIREDNNTGFEKIDLITSSPFVGIPFFGNELDYYAAIIRTNKEGNLFAFKLSQYCGSGGVVSWKATVLDEDIFLCAYPDSAKDEIACVPVESVSFLSEIMTGSGKMRYFNDGLLELRFIDTIVGSPMYGKTRTIVTTPGIGSYMNVEFRRFSYSLRKINGYENAKDWFEKQYLHDEKYFGITPDSVGLDKWYVLRYPSITNNMIEWVPISLFSLLSVKVLKEFRDDNE